MEKSEKKEKRTMSERRIAILGAGPVGSTLGRKWSRAGHTVAFGVKDPSSERAQSLRAILGEHVLIGSPADALATSDIAVPGEVVEELITTHARLLDHKIVIEAANKLPYIQKTLSTKKWADHEPLTSLSTLQAHAPHAQVYRAFNSYGWEPFADPIYQGVQADLFYCGPEGETQTVVEQLITEVGLCPVRLGDVDQVEVVDDVLRLWVTLALLQGKGRDQVALKVLTR
jgi:predicted dinucleotide-binding enzyme